MEELIKWMEEQKDANPRDYLLFEHYNAAIAKAKELQGKEKWAVVSNYNIFTSKETAEKYLPHPIHYTIVKIIEP